MENNPDSKVAVGKSGSVYYEYAGFWVRLAAYIIDSIILTLILIPFFIVFFVLLVSSGEAFFDSPLMTILNLSWIIIGPFVTFLYMAPQLLRWEASFGKRAMGLKVIRQDKQKLNLITIFMREVIGKFIAGLIFNIGYLWVGYDVRKRGWQDMIAKTYVVHNDTISKEEYDKQVNRKPKKWVLLIIFFPFILGFMSILLSIVLIAINPAEQFYQANLTACNNECGEDQMCIAACMEEHTGGYSGESSTGMPSVVTYTDEDIAQWKEEIENLNTLISNMNTWIGQDVDQAKLQLIIEQAEEMKQISEDLVTKMNKDEELTDEDYKTIVRYTVLAESVQGLMEELFGSEVQGVSVGKDQQYLY